MILYSTWVYIYIYLYIYIFINLKTTVYLIRQFNLSQNSACIYSWICWPDNYSINILRIYNFGPALTFLCFHSSIIYDWLHNRTQQQIRITFIMKYDQVFQEQCKKTWDVLLRVKCRAPNLDALQRGRCTCISSKWSL